MVRSRRHSRTTSIAIASSGRASSHRFRVLDSPLSDNYGKLQVRDPGIRRGAVRRRRRRSAPCRRAGSNGQALEVVSGLPAWVTPLNDIASPGASIAVTNPSGPTVDLDVASSGVSAGTYGDSGDVPQITVGLDGRVTTRRISRSAAERSLVPTDGCRPLTPGFMRPDQAGEPRRSQSPGLIAPSQLLRPAHA